MTESTVSNNELIKKEYIIPLQKVDLAQEYGMRNHMPVSEVVELFYRYGIYGLIEKHDTQISVRDIEAIIKYTDDGRARE